jgi:pyruvate dehydrogenase E2 component (dihydrolipoamide acetyltransferase)
VAELILPKLGMYDGDATLVEWLVDDGAEVSAGDALFVVETDKLENEIEADDPGVLVREVEAGFRAAIGTRIGCLVSSREDYDRMRAAR